MPMPHAGRVIPGPLSFQESDLAVVRPIASNNGLSTLLLRRRAAQVAGAGRR